MHFEFKVHNIIYQRIWHSMSHLYYWRSLCVGFESAKEVAELVGMSIPRVCVYKNVTVYCNLPLEGYWRINAVPWKIKMMCSIMSTLFLNCAKDTHCLVSSSHQFVNLSKCCSGVIYRGRGDKNKDKKTPCYRFEMSLNFGVGCVLLSFSVKSLSSRNCR